MKKCVNCHHPVSNGDRHALNACPPPAGRKRRKKRNRIMSQLPDRGAPVTGTGVPKGASKG